MRNRITHCLVALTAVGALAASQAPARTLEIVETAHEAALGDVTFPTSTAGTVIFRSCASCDPVALPVSSATRYIGPQGPVPLADFLLQMAELRQGATASEAILVTVFRRADDGRVTRIRVAGPN